MVADMTDNLLGKLDNLRRKDEDWVQIDVAAPGASATMIARSVATIADELRSRGSESRPGTRIGRWWFVRKHPGVRIRIEAPGLGEAVGAAARSALSELGPCTISPYEAERYRFGGDEGMDVAHDQFALDSSLAVLRERGQVPPVPWSAWLLNDLCQRLTDDPAESWDAWKRLEEILGPGKSASGMPSRMSDHVNQAIQQVSEAVVPGNKMVAERLRQATLAHDVGIRTWFGAAAVFHWNRLGLRPAAMQQVVAAALLRFDSR